MYRFCLILGLIAPSLTWACDPWSDELKNDDSLRVGEITLVVNDVFNTELENESQEVYKLVNKLHIESRNSHIQAQLLFEEGDVFELDLLEETARNLRRNAYLRSAEVTPTSVCDGLVNILVETGDNWSLAPNINFSRAGGQNEFAIALSELNLLGLGKTVAIGLDFGLVRDQRVIQYIDPMLFGSDTRLNAQLQHNTDGEVQSLQFDQPFTSLDARRSWRVSAANIEFEQSLYDNGPRVDQLAVDSEVFLVQRGYSTGKRVVGKDADGDDINRISRLRLGWQYEILELGPTDLFPNSTAVEERIFSYPFAELSVLQPKFIKQSNLQIMESVEDVNVGHTLKARIGIAAEAFGSSFDSIQTTFNYAGGYQLGQRFLGLFDAEFDAYLTDDGAQNALTKATAEGFYFYSRKSQFYASLNAVSASRLHENRQVIIGGGTGLRGYPLRFQTGTKRARATLEQRYFFDWYPLRLARIGTAAFVDVGSSWDNGEDPDWLTDVGFGLRIVGTRQANAKVTHIDFAFPLDNTDGIDGVQVVVSIKSEF